MLSVSVFSVPKLVVRVTCILLLLSLGAQASAARLDILFVYDEGVERDGWSPDVVARSLVDEGNIIYANSNVDIQLNFMGTFEKTLDFSNLNNDGKLATLRRNAEVLDERNRTRADFVVYLTSDFLEGFCGWGYIAAQERFAYSLLRPYCGAVTFVHELGHNMGLQHARRQLGMAGSGFTTPHLDYGWGYGVDNSFATIMSYPGAFNAPNYIARFSDPNATCRGLPCGQPVSSSESAYAVEALNQVKETAASFRVGEREEVVFDLPARIEAEDYFFANDATPGNVNSRPVTKCQYRGFDVDVFDTSDDDTCAVGWGQEFEYVNYQVGQAGGVYDVTLRVATRLNDRRLWLTVNGRLAEEITLSGTSWSDYQNITIRDVEIPSNAELRLRWINGAVNVNYLDVQNAEYSVLPVSSDAYIRDGIFADSIFSSVEGLAVKTGTTDTSRRAVFKIARGGITAPVTKAKLRFRVRSAQPTVARGFAMYVNAIGNDWNDSNVTWNRIGEPGELITRALTQPKNAWIDVDITDYFNAQAGQAFTSLAISNLLEGSGSYWAIFSNESPSVPELVIIP